MSAERENCLLDAWMPPEGSGEPLGCVATTFTFSAAFFEEECLGRMLAMQSDPETEATAYVLEREERLAGFRAAVIVDQHFAKGSRNLRWDLLASRPTVGIQHAKVSLLVWTQAIRLIVASANLTPDGYRRNHEIYTVFDFNEESDSPRECLLETLGFLEAIVSETCPAAPASARTIDFLKSIRPKVAAWSRPQSNRTGDQPKTVMVFSGLNHSSVLDQLRECWPAGAPAEEARVLSPFFDAGKTQPAGDALWSLMRQRGGDSSIEYSVVAEDDSKGALLIHAPASLATSVPNGRCSVNFAKLNLQAGRPLHAKSIQLSNGYSILQCIGSSNFTSAGLGIGGRKNIEANVAFILTPGSTGKAYRKLQAIWPEVEQIETKAKVRFQADDPAFEDEPAQDQLPLPTFFVAANFQKDTHEARLLELVTAENPPEGWKLSLEDGSVFVTAADWIRAGRPPVWRISWSRSLPPSGFDVTWGEKGATAWLAVNLRSPSDIPPPEALQNLTLEVLLDLLTSARPLYQLLAGRATNSQAARSGHGSVELDPHRRVDTSEFLLQRTRRFSRALAGLRARFERPIASAAGLEWAIEGPVGVMSLWRAINADYCELARAAERAFLLAELALELRRIRPVTARGCLPVDSIRKALHHVVLRLENEVQPLLPGLHPGMSQYVQAAVAAARQ